MLTQRVGGSFAPPLDKAKLAEYEKLESTIEDRQIADYFRSLIAMLRHFWKTPASKLPGSPHPSGTGVIVPLEEDEIKRIWDSVPWSEECDLIGQVFDKLETGPLRNAAYHLLWYARFSKGASPVLALVWSGALPSTSSGVTSMALERPTSASSMSLPR